MAETTPTDRKYSQTHEWFKVEGDVVTVGITRHAVDALTDITYVQMKPAGTKIAAGGGIGEVESVKTTSDIYSAVAGEVTEVNKSLADDPAQLNADPYGKGWLLKIKMSDKGGLAGLMDAAKYDATAGA
jgi:glycine cleavage system H protein